MDTEESWAVIASQRRSLADLLESLSAEQWESRDPLPIAPCHAGRRRSTVLLYC